MVATVKVIKICPECGKETRFNYLDSVQEWYICENKHQTAKPLEREITKDDVFEKPQMPKCEDYSGDEPFSAALEGYKELLEEYNVRKDYVDSLKKQAETDLQDDFHLLRDIRFPTYDAFCETLEMGNLDIFNLVL